MSGREQRRNREGKERRREGGKRRKAHGDGEAEKVSLVDGLGRIVGVLGREGPGLAALLDFEVPA